MQAEFDRRVNKALETNRTKMQAEIETQIANARTEAEKLAKMNAEQKAQYEQQKKEKELEEPAESKGHGVFFKKIIKVGGDCF